MKNLDRKSLPTDSPILVGELGVCVVWTNAMSRGHHNLVSVWRTNDSQSDRDSRQRLATTVCFRAS